MGHPEVDGRCYDQVRFSGSGEWIRKQSNEEGREGSASLAGYGPLEVFRRAYCAARLQTLDRGAPVAVDAVRASWGAGGAEMVEKVYGHLGEVGIGPKWSGIRVERHMERLGEASEPCLWRSALSGI